MFKRLRAHPPRSIGGLEVAAVRDLGTGVDTAQPDGKAVLPWQPGDLMISYTLREEGAWLTLRASGTEPKLKYYVEARSPAAAAALEAAVATELVRPQEHGLTRPQH